MDDLISRQAAIDALWEIRQEEISDGRRFHNHCSLSTAVDVIKDLPSAQPERKKGKWIDGLPYINSHWWVCSVCHVSAPENHTGYNFCPSCGADMRGE